MHADSDAEQPIEEAPACPQCGTATRAELTPVVFHRSRVHLRRAAGGLLAVLVLLLAGAVYVAGNYFILPSANSVMFVKKAEFSLAEVLLTWNMVSVMSIDEMQQRYPEVLKSLQQDGYMAFKRDAREMEQDYLKGLNEVAPPAR